MPVRPLPSHPSLDHLKHQAKDLINAHAERNPAAAQRLREFNPSFHSATDAEIFAANLPLSAAQLTIAREYGFPSWPRLKTQIQSHALTNPPDLPLQDRIDDPVFRQAVALIDSGDEAGLRAHLKAHSQLVNQHVAFEGMNYFRNPTLLNFIAENPIRNGTMPANIIAIAEVILDATLDSSAKQSAINETLALVCSGCIARACRQQIPLIDLLCDRGADPDIAMQPAIGHGEFEAARALIAHGAAVTLPVAAALEDLDTFRRLLPCAPTVDRHLALALASQFGHVELVRLLLDAGEDPNRYNPPKSHSHSTPLHQAAFAGHEQVVRLLVERGARLDIKDILWNGTPADWAHHGGKTEVEAYLRALERTP